VDPAAVAGLAAVQRELLLSAAGRLTAGGRIVYSTCALLPEENREVVESLLAARKEFTLAAERETRPRSGYADGGDLALLRREFP
jgi:16S rRNA (cytosine967-C5)-methyltransferase